MGRKIYQLEKKISLLASDLYSRGALNDDKRETFTKGLGQDFNYEALKKAWHPETSSLTPRWERAIASFARIDISHEAWVDPMISENERLSSSVERRDTPKDFERYLRSRPFSAPNKMVFDVPQLLDTGMATFALEPTPQLEQEKSSISLFFRLVMKPGYEGSSIYGFNSVRLRINRSAGAGMFEQLLGENAPVTIRDALLTVRGGRFHPEWFLSTTTMLSGEYLTTAKELCRLLGGASGDEFIADVAVCRRNFTVLDEAGNLLSDKKKERIIGILEFMKMFDLDRVDSHGWIELGTQRVRLL